MDAKKSILLTNFHQHGGGGHTTYLIYLYNYLTHELKLNVFVACPKESKLYKMISKLNESHAIDINFPGKIKEIKGMLHAVNKIRKLIEQYNIQLVHTNGNPDQKIVTMAKFFYHRNVKILRTKHDAKVIKNKWLSKLLYKKLLDKLIVVSEYQLQHVLPSSLTSQTTVIKNGIDLNYFKPRAKNAELKKLYKLKDEDLVLVSVAGTAPHKGWQYLTKAISLLEHEVQKKIKIILAGNQRDRETHKKYIDDYQLLSPVIFTGLVDDVRDIISIGDVGFVLSSSIETISFACREMMAMGLPVIVSDYAGLPENIEHGKSGWITTVKNSESIRQVLIDIFANRHTISSASTMALKKATTEFGLERFLKPTYSLYQQVLNEKYL